MSVSASSAKRWPAAVPLEQLEQRMDPGKVLVGVALVPDPEGQERQEMNKVVVEQDRQRRTVHRLAAALRRQIAQDVERDRFPVDAASFAVPVVEDVKALLPRSPIELANDLLQIDPIRPSQPDVRPHAVGQHRQRAPERRRRRGLVEDRRPDLRLHRRFDLRARAAELTR